MGYGSALPYISGMVRWTTISQGSKKNGVEAKICARAYRNKPLTDEQKGWNKSVAKTRCRIEHIFGFMTNSLHGLFVRSIGMVRASFNIDLTNLILLLPWVILLTVPIASYIAVLQPLPLLGKICLD